MIKQEGNVIVALEARNVQCNPQEKVLGKSNIVICSFKSSDIVCIGKKPGMSSNPSQNEPLFSLLSDGNSTPEITKMLHDTAILFTSVPKTKLS